MSPRKLLIWVSQSHCMAKLHAPSQVVRPGEKVACRGTLLVAKQIVVQGTLHKSHAILMANKLALLVKGRAKLLEITAILMVWEH